MHRYAQNLKHDKRIKIKLCYEVQVSVLYLQKPEEIITKQQKHYDNLLNNLFCTKVQKFDFE